MAILAAVLGSNVSAQESASSPQVEELVITGSRVITNGDASPAPVQVYTTEDALSVSPGQLADALQVLPALVGSRGSGSNPTSTGSVSGGSGAANQLNLRNLGINRTLVLVDGLRIPPTLFNNAVDVDIIPQMLVERVDLVTGGVSAVYGSDAVSGVVNYIIDKDFDGLKININKGISDRSDGEKTNMGIAFGTDIADGRGHFIGSYEYREEEGVLYRSDREWMNQWGVTGAGSEANPYSNNNNLRQRNYAFGGLIRSGALSGQHFATDGVLSPFDRGEDSGTGSMGIGGDGAYYDSSLLQPMDSDQLFARLSYDITDNVQGYVQLFGNMKTNHNYAEWLALNNVTLASDNAFLAPEYQQVLADAGEATFRLGQFNRSAPRSDGISESDQWALFGGLTGTKGDYSWGVDYVLGRTELSTVLAHNTNFHRLAAALDAVDDGNGNIVCNITITNPGVEDDCVPLNPFGPTAASAEAFAYVQQATGYKAETNTSDITGYITGDLFELPAGPVAVALSAEWREISFESTSETQTGADQSSIDCDLIRYNCDPDSLYAATFAGTDEISDTVWETAIEFDAPIFDNGSTGLNLNGAARYTDYERAGTYTTWKLGLDWRLLEQLRFRATRSEDIRAPTLYDLYAPLNTVLIQPTDLLTGLSPLVPSFNQGNVDLTSEIGETFTAGIVWSATDDLSIALDYYDISITDAILQVNGSTTSFQNICYETAGASPYCSLQLRPNGFTDTSAANAVTGWFANTLNIAEVSTEGVDLEVNYSTDLADRPLRLRLLAAYQPHVYYEQPGVDTRDQGNVAFGPFGTAAGPSKRLTAFARYSATDSLTLDLMYQWRNSMDISGFPSHVFAPGEGTVDSWSTTNINLTYSLPTRLGDTDLYFNIQNMFDKNPPGGTYTSNGTRSGLRDGYPAGDNPMGRYFTVGVRVSM